MDTNAPNLNQGDSLEADTAVVKSEGTSDSTNTADATIHKPGSPDSDGQKQKPDKSGSLVSRLIKRVNIYLLLFILLIVAGGIIFVVAFLTNRGTVKPTVQTQSLSSGTLKQLASSNVTVGQPKQTLNVQSDAVFAGKVLIQDSLEVAGPIKVGGSLSIPGITVSGNSVFDQVVINKTLSVGGDSGFAGQVAVQKNLSVAGGATFGGAISAPQITANTLQLNSDLNITHHIAAGGSTPGRSNGVNLGVGGTTSVGGSDSAGSININTGSGASAGCFLTITFTQKYNATPHVLITPVGAGAADIGYFVTRTTSGFSVCAADAPPSNSNFGFDYFVLD